MNYSHWIFDLDNTLADSAIDFDALRQELGIPPGKPILEEIDTRPDAEAALLHRRLGELERNFARRATPLPGAHEMLTALAGRGAQLGILTRNSRTNALETLAVCDLAKHFEPEQDTAVMVGDFRYDLEAGRRAGTATIYYDVEDKGQWTAEADFRVRSHSELLTLIEGENA